MNIQIQQALKEHNYNDLKQLIENVDDFKSAVRSFPDYEASLVEFLSEPDVFNRLIKDHKDFMMITRDLPSHKEALITMSRVLSDPEAFDRLIKNNKEFIDTARQYAPYKPDLIRMSRVLSNIEAFDRLIKNEYEFKSIKEAFNKYNVFKEDNFESQRLQVVQTVSSAKAFTRGATVGALAGGELSQKLPPEVSSYIGSFLGRKDGANLAQTRKEANELAKEEEERQNTLKPGK
ncbi:hypothetical protein [Legionella sp. WA2024007413]